MPNEWIIVDLGGGVLLTVQGAWKTFHLAACHEYALSGWNYDGGYIDNQTPPGGTGVKSYFKDQFHTIVGVITPDDTYHQPYDWTSIWYIKNC